MHDLRTRSPGLTKFIQLHVVLDPTLSLGRAHVIGDRIEATIQDAFPQAEVILHVDPVERRRTAPARTDAWPAVPRSSSRTSREVIAFLEKRLAPAKRRSTRTARWSSCPAIAPTS